MNNNRNISFRNAKYSHITFMFSENICKSFAIKNNNFAYIMI